jgi:hypothetical protein
MISRIALVFAAAVTLAACASHSPGGPDFDTGMWGGQPIHPPAGLLTAKQGDLVGRTVNDPYGPSPLVVDYVLVDPNNGQARYAVLSTRKYDRYVIVPVSAMAISPYSVTVNANEGELDDLPHMSLAELQHRYPQTVLTPAPPGALGTAAALPPAPVPPPATPPSEPLRLVRSGSVAGEPVVDSFGRPIGRVDAVAAVPSTGEVRYVIVSSPSFGPDSYVVAPASSAHTSGGEVVLAGSSTSWMQAPRYRSEQLRQSFGML